MSNLMIKCTGVNNTIETTGKGPCKNGNKCPDKGCWFAHPDGWSAQKAKAAQPAKPVL